MDATLGAWDEGDEDLERFTSVAVAEGLQLVPRWSQRPRCIQRGGFRSWTADLSVIEVQLNPRLV